MTKKNALTVALNALNFVNSDEANEAKATIASMIDALSKAHPMSDEAKAKQNEIRKAKTAAARATLVAQVAPIIRNAMTSEPQTAKEIFSKCVGLPEGFTAAKVQNVLLREMATEVNRIEAKGKANTYSL